MMVLLLIGAIVAGALGNWWLAAGLWGAGVIISAGEVRREGLRRRGVSQLRRRQLDRVIDRQRIR